ncbi:uncharacterized protein B0H18DRAFT_1018223 [Fomitopsis serialis]|uniref:uncharacterized protein n=1 Tax=Fomitopsis serialis TaxID=139415 RepID=UPI002007E5AE|nr:uncharacterized protein B0H18DRAFT_1018223 [Neoantrodia serialis]KAH9922403.1 hypothetical protein B0H18DRAFT_1018223 [Neoantrodia serialis]
MEAMRWGWMMGAGLAARGASASVMSAAASETWWRRSGCSVAARLRGGASSSAPPGPSAASHLRLPLSSWMAGASELRRDAKSSEDFASAMTASLRCCATALVTCLQEMHWVKTSSTLWCSTPGIVDAASVERTSGFFSAEARMAFMVRMAAALRLSRAVPGAFPCASCWKTSELCGFLEVKVDGPATGCCTGASPRADTA